MGRIAFRGRFQWRWQSRYGYSQPAGSRLGWPFVRHRLQRARRRSVDGVRSPLGRHAPQRRLQFNDDGKTDLAVFTPENQWKVNLSSGASFDAPGSGTWTSAAGLWGELPTVGDFNGDGKTDIAILNANSEWWLGLSSGSAFDAPGSGRWPSGAGAWCDVPLNAPDFWRFDHLTPNMQNLWEGRFRLAGCGQ